jgi:hypothetical protein
MATPDIQNLFERFLQIYGGQSGSTEPTRSEPRYQSSQPAYSASADAYGSDAPAGGVLRGWSAPSPTAPSWAQALAGPGGMPVGLGGPRLGGRIVGFPFPPMPLGPGTNSEPPKVHIPEWLTPESIGHAWLERQLLPWTLWRRMHGDDKSSGNMQEPDDARSSEPSPEQPPDSLPTGILGLILEAARNRRLNSNDDRLATSSATDPNHRQLTVVSPPNRTAPSIPPDPVSTYFDWLAQAKKARGPQGSWARSNSSFGGSSPDGVRNGGEATKVAGATLVTTMTITARRASSKKRMNVCSDGKTVSTRTQITIGGAKRGPPRDGMPAIRMVGPRRLGNQRSGASIRTRKFISIQGDERRSEGVSSYSD